MRLFARCTFGAGRYGRLARLAVLGGVLLVSCLWATGVASAAPTPCAALVIDSVSYSPSTPIAGQPTTIYVEITNTGTCAAGSFVTQFHGSAFAGVGASGAITGLAASSTTTLALSYVFPSAGNFEAYVRVNTGNSVSVTDPNDELALAPVTVAARSLDLAITNYTVNPTTPDPQNVVVSGSPAIASITVENTGNVAAGQFNIQWRPGVLSAAPLTATVPGLAPGASTTVTFNYTYPTAATYDAVATADPGSTLNETSTAGSTETDSVIVEPPLPELEITGLGVTTGVAGQPTTTTITIYNEGNADAGAFVVRWAPGAGLPAQAQNVAGLAEYGYVTLTFTTIYPTAGTYTGTATADSTHAVSQVSTAGNTLSTTFTIGAAGVDLAVTNVSVSPTSPEQEVGATVSVTVTNLGNVPSGSYSVSWNPDVSGPSIGGNQTQTQTDSTPLDPGDSAVLEFTYAYPKPGNFDTLAQVTSLGGVTDTNTSNNEELLNLTVVPEPIDMSVSGIDNPCSGTEFDGKFGYCSGTATVTVTNNGPLAVGGFSVVFYDDYTTGPPAQTGSTQFVSGLNVGQSVTLVYHFTITWSGGSGPTVTQKVFVDPSNTIDKTVEPLVSTSTFTITT